MDCTTIRQGRDCPFMAKKGCTFNGGICHEIVEQCKGCNRSAEITTGWFCDAFPDPSAKWRNGNCNMATHVSSKTAEKKIKINPIKASKRGNR
ncbi:MAG: PxxKW family cysteine-rich protein [Desulfobacterales bacterium]